MKNKHYDDNNKIYFQDIINRESFKEVRKFNQLTQTLDLKNQKGKITNKILNWLNIVEWRSPEQSNFLKFYKFEEQTKGTKSSRIYDKEYKLNYKTISKILSTAFGADENYHRPFPSGGALYSVYPILLILKNNVVSNLSAGVYYYDAIDNGLYFLKDMSKKNMNDKLKDLLFPIKDKIPSNYCIAYIGDFYKEIIKYNETGYKNILLETGMMSQSFRNTIKKFNNQFSDLSYLGFQGNALSDFIGFDKDTSPILLVQWFGKNYEINK